MLIVAETCPVPECNLAPRDVERLVDDLATYHAHFAAAFACPEQAAWAAQYSSFVAMETGRASGSSIESMSNCPSSSR